MICLPFKALLLVAALSWSGGALASTLGDAALLQSSPRRATLLEGLQLDSSLRPSLSPPLRLTDGIRFSHTRLPSLDHGGALDEGSRQTLAMTLGFLVGFGVGHLVARDSNGFALFVIVDVALIMGAILLDVFLHGPFAVLGIATLVASHVVQGIDAFNEAGGAPLADRGTAPARRVIGWTF